MAIIRIAAQSAKPIAQIDRFRQFVLLSRLSFVTYNFSPLYETEKKR